MKFLCALLILSAQIAYGQGSANNIFSVLTESDSVIIVKHETLVVPGKPGWPSTTKEILINGKPNDDIILTSTKLSRRSINSLAVILTKETAGDIVTMACFDPHHAVYIFRKEKVSYLDICFGCRQFSYTKEINTGGHQLTNETWLELESFFNAEGIETKTGIKQ